jgi:acetylornithine deacetylase
MDPFDIISWVDQHRAQMIEFLQALVRIPSVTGNELGIQKFLKNYLLQAGFQVDSFVPNLEELSKHPAFVHVDVESYANRPNVVATLKGVGGGRSLLFNGHVDVIPEGPASNWMYGCWSAEIADNRIYGRGTSDMKSGVAAFTMALDAIVKMGIKLKGDVIAEYVIDEELSGNGTLACVMAGYRADAGICCETSSMCIQPASIGRIWFEINIRGKAAGIQKRFDGISAIELGYKVTKIIEAYEQLRLNTVSHHLYPNIIESIPCSVGIFESGSYASAFPDECVLKGSIATVPGEDSDTVKQEFVDYILEQTKNDEWMAANPPEIIFKGYFADPSELPKNSPIVECLSHHYEAILGETAVISGRQGAADTRFLNTYGQTPTVIFGPGMTEQMHANNEWVDIDDYLNSIKVLIATVIDWCGVAE